MRRRLAPALILCLMLSGCAAQQTSTPSPGTLTPLQKVSTGLLDFAKGIAVVQSTAIQANSQGLLTNARTTEILTYCNQANLIGKQATAVTRQISTLDKPSADKVLQILTPAIVNIGTLVTGETNQNLKALLVGLQTTLTTIQLSIAGGS